MSTVPVIFVLLLCRIHSGGVRSSDRAYVAKPQEQPAFRYTISRLLELRCIYAVDCAVQARFCRSQDCAVPSSDLKADPRRAKSPTGRRAPPSFGMGSPQSGNTAKQTVHIWTNCFHQANVVPTTRCWHHSPASPEANAVEKYSMGALA